MIWLYGLLGIILLLLYLWAGLWVVRRNATVCGWLVMLADRRHGLNPAWVVCVVAVTIMSWPIHWWIFSD